MVFGRPIYLPVDVVLAVLDPEMNRQTFWSEFIHNYGRNKIQLSPKHTIKEYSKRIHQHLSEKVILFGSTPQNTQAIVRNITTTHSGFGHKWS